jgi:hypothetical protein
MAENNTEWRYHHVEADGVDGIDFDRYGRNGFELCGLTSHNGKLVAVFKRNPTAKDEAGRAARKARKGRERQRDRGQRFPRNPGTLSRHVQLVLARAPIARSSSGMVGPMPLARRWRRVPVAGRVPLLRLRPPRRPTAAGSLAGPCLRPRMPLPGRACRTSVTRGLFMCAGRAGADWSACPSQG